MAQVEKAPTVVKAGLKKEEAEELKKKLEAGIDPPDLCSACAAEPVLTCRLANFAMFQEISSICHACSEKVSA